MKLFSRKPFSSNIQIALDGTTFKSYTPAQLTEGISLNEVEDFSKITVKGSSGEENFKNLNVITKAFELKPVYKNISFACWYSSSNYYDSDSQARYIVGGVNVPGSFNASDLRINNNTYRCLLVFKKDDIYYIGIDKNDDPSEYNIVLIYADGDFKMEDDIEKSTYVDDSGNEQPNEQPLVKSVRVKAISGFYEISDFGKYQDNNN